MPLLVIDETGTALHTLRPPRATPLQRLSGQMVGYWSTQTIRAAVELGVPDALPATAEACATATSLSPEIARGLLRALWELRLVERTGETWGPTDTGRLLRRDHVPSAADAALVWGGEHYEAWGHAVAAMKRGHCGFEARFGEPFFDWLSSRARDRGVYHRAMRTYAEHDYAGISMHLPLDGVTRVVDAGGGTGALLTSVLADHPALRGTLLERPEVANSVSIPPSLAPRIAVVAGDLFAPWRCSGDLILLARVLHDWEDARAVAILRRAHEALTPAGHIALIEMILAQDCPDGSLLDLNMLVMCGSRERTYDDWEALAHAAGLRLRRVAALPTYGSVLILEKARVAGA